jgi:hypothetical protein
MKERMKKIDVKTVIILTSAIFLVVTIAPIAAQASEWVQKADTPETGGYGEAAVGTGNYIYAARCLYSSSTPYFWLYNPVTDSWTSMNSTGLPRGAFRNGAALTWDHNDAIFALFGGRYTDINRTLFYRYIIPNDTWERLTDTPHAQGAGDSITWSGYDDLIYALLGSKEHGTAFACFNSSNNSWSLLPFNSNWTTTDDGASLVWTGGEYLYALRGEWEETVPCQDFARYHIPSKTWRDMSSIPESDGVGDGGSLLWTENQPNYIFALGGNSCLEDPGYNFYRYSIFSDSWEELESILCPVGNYVGNRFGFADGHIYYWQGTPSTWECGGDAFYLYESSPSQSTNVTISGRQILVNGNSFTVKGVGYAPTPIGETPEVAPYDYFDRVIYDRDLPLLRAMNANTIRLWGWDYAKDHTAFLDAAYNNGTNPIYVIVSYWVDPYKDFSEPQVREEIKNEFRTMVETYKDHPAVLMWCVGNELNGDWLSVDLSAWYSLLDECAQIGHAVEGDSYHPVTTANWEIYDIVEYDDSLTYLDAWGLNVYRGTSFGDLFADYANISSKPMWISEYGIDAFDNRYGDEYENVGTPYQASYAGNLWDEIEANFSLCSGGSIMAYCDEWWKAGNPYSHDNGGYSTSAHPDGFSNEEWWGIMRTVANGSGPDIIQPREVYYTLKSKFGMQNFDTRESSNPYPSLSGTHNGTITPFYDINVSKMYTYPCPGTGGHTESVKIWNSTGWNVTATWNGYVGDWHNISFDDSFTLYANHTYNYTIRTGSYPQIHHTPQLLTAKGWITCSEFVDVNGKRHEGWIPAIRLS